MLCLKAFTHPPKKKKKKIPLWNSSALARFIELLSLNQDEDKSEVPPLQMPIQYGSIPSSSFEWAVRDLPFCLSDPIDLLHDELMAVGIPFCTSAVFTPFSAPGPTSMVVLVDPVHQWLFLVVEILSSS